MKTVARFFLTLLFSLAFTLQAGAAVSSEATCNGPQSAVSVVVANAGVSADCQMAAGEHSQSTGEMCKAGSFCPLSLTALPANQAVVPMQELNVVYPAESIQFALQDFSRTLLRPPSLV
ncbi:hypothetical protein [Pseudogulbenkiania sp. MAI-1]|uniref:hypothetical protein n=1 Tax=Pseudogulbenkiania sp. MAI-1 TaxID=990370 RepID=UPI00045EC687|nr:hypothetical protein [Pseudogulbenkiania sp. MAI-1]